MEPCCKGKKFRHLAVPFRQVLLCNMYRCNVITVSHIQNLGANGRWRPASLSGCLLPGNYSVVCLTTGPKPLPKRFLHIVRSKAPSFKRDYPLLSLRLSSSFLRLLPRLLVTSISPFIFPSITCFRRQFLRKM